MSLKSTVADKKTDLKRTHVPDKVYAYSLQIRHSMYELLKASPNDTISIEVFEDIGIESQGDVRQAIQLKSSLSDNNPVSNRSVDLWKTFYNWILAVNSNELDIKKTTFKIFVAANKTGSIVSMFSKADSKETAKEAYLAAKAEFYDESDNEIDLADGYALYVRECFKTQNSLNMILLIHKFSLEMIKTNHIELLYDAFSRLTTVPNELIEDVFNHMLGWLDKSTALMVENKKPMTVSQVDFKNELIAITRTLNQNRSLVEIAGQPTEEDIVSEYNSLRIFVRQLNIVDCDYDDKIEAISDYLRASINRSLWGEKGLLPFDFFDSYEEELVRVWKDEKKRIEIIHEEYPDEKKGKLLYLNCKGKNVPYNHLSVPAFFVPGCYHALSDELMIGWHPKYKIKLTGGRNDE